MTARLRAREKVARNQEAALPLPKGLPMRLRAFLGMAAPHLDRATPKISATRLTRVLSMIEAPLASARSGGAFLNVWTVAGLKDNEVRNTAVLAWLLDPYGSHGLADAFPLRLLAKIRPCPEWLDGLQALGSIKVTLEERPLASTENRIDITIEGPDFVLYLESKIRAVEGERQLDRYQEDLLRTALARNKAHPLIVLLTRKGRATTSSVAAAVLSWRDVQTSADQVARSLAVTDHRRMLLEQFSRHIDSF